MDLTKLKLIEYCYNAFFKQAPHPLSINQ